MAMVTDYNGDGELDVLSFVKDHHNSVRLILNEKKEIVQSIGYSAYGETILLNDGVKNPKLKNSFYYTGRELEAETGDYYYRARYYNPGAGRFLSEDPIGYRSDDSNFYRYVLNNPVNLKDPRGTHWTEDYGMALLCKLSPRCCTEKTFSDAYKCLIDSSNIAPKPPEDPPKNSCED